MTQTHSAAPALAWDLQDRLAKALRVSGKSNGQLATELGVHRNTISNYLSGRQAPDRRTLIAWAFATGVPVEWLENGTTPAGPDNGPDEGGLGIPVSIRWLATAA